MKKIYNGRTKREKIKERIEQSIMKGSGNINREQSRGEKKRDSNPIHSYRGRNIIKDLTTRFHSNHLITCNVNHVQCSLEGLVSRGRERGKKRGVRGRKG